MRSKVAGKPNAGNLYEIAADLGTSGSLADRMRLAEESTDATAAKNAVTKWRAIHDGTNNPPGTP